MRQRENRHDCHQAACFIVRGRPRWALIQNVSRSGMLAYLGPGVQVGQKIKLRLEGIDLNAKIVRLDSQGHAALNLEFPLTRSEMMAVASGDADGCVDPGPVDVRDAG